MFLPAVLERNPNLISAAVELHQQGLMPPNSFVIDVDTVAENAAKIRQAADKLGLALYFTTKQVGFNPLVARRVVEAGIPKAIAIDTQEAFALSRHNVPIGHLGHLVQIPRQLISPMLALEPEVVTVFGVEKARQISQAAERDGRQVALLLRVIAEGDFLFPGQPGGFCLDTLAADVLAIRDLPNIRIVGVTSFPCLELDAATHTLVPTRNFHTIVRAAHLLRSQMGIDIQQINAPGNTCVASLETLARTGATHGEPGHALTGTTYLHADGRQAETPAMVYVSEVTHLAQNGACAVGGGLYRRSKVNDALVGCDPARMARTEALPLDPTAIDYYVTLNMPAGQRVNVGDSVVFASRSQAFITRSYVAVLANVPDGHPRLLGLFDPLGREVAANVQQRP